MGSLRPRPLLGKQRIQAFKLVDHLDLLKEVYSLLFVVLSYFAGPLDESMYSTVDETNKACMKITLCEKGDTNKSNQLVLKRPHFPTASCLSRMG